MSYFLWRLLYVVIKPLCLLLAGKFVSVEMANFLAVTITVSAILMAALSFGTYKAYLASSELERPINGRYRLNVYLFNALVMMSLAIVLSVIYHDLGYLTLMGIVVLTEHLIHDEARVLLYRGNKLVWARQNTVRTFSLYGTLLATSLISQSAMLISTLIVFIALAVLSTFTNGIFSYIKIGISIGPSFFQNYLAGFKYFKSSLINKFGQQSDRIYFFIISPDSLWIYALLAQSASVMLTYFDVVHLAKFKSQLLSNKLFRFSFLSRYQVLELGAIGVAVVSGVLILECLQIFPDLMIEHFLLLLIFLAGNVIVTTNTLNSERMFWSLKNPRSFLLIEVKSFLFGLSIVIPILVLPCLVLVRAPYLLTCIFKLYKAKQCLR